MMINSLRRHDVWVNNLESSKKKKKNFKAKLWRIFFFFFFSITWKYLVPPAVQHSVQGYRPILSWNIKYLETAKFIHIRLQIRIEIDRFRDYHVSNRQENNRLRIRLSKTLGSNLIVLAKTCDNMTLILFSGVLIIKITFFCSGNI